MPTFLAMLSVTSAFPAGKLLLKKIQWTSEWPPEWMHFPMLKCKHGFFWFSMCSMYVNLQHCWNTCSTKVLLYNNFHLFLTYKKSGLTLSRSGMHWGFRSSKCDLFIPYFLTAKPFWTEFVMAVLWLKCSVKNVSLVFLPQCVLYEMTTFLTCFATSLMIKSL